ncbi:MAG TPA: carboxypeptidase regulatory-like domain-containing protein [Bryobacteraceae bacterium]|nr:carboxypeptidase regulatory-like domain-containing protein [Bryobacteraceae bacterium]
MHAQLDRGTITGTVTDPAGAVVPAATITLTHTGTQGVSTATSNENGQFSRPNLPIGQYRMTVEAAGFKRSVREDVELGVTQVLRLDVQLEIGSATESVQVTAEVPRLQTDTPQISTSLTSSSLTNLPLSFSGGRQAESFAYMITPGVSGGTFESHINGSTSFSKETLVDGASVTVNQGGDFAPMAVSVEALQEVRFQTSGMTAEYGRTQAGVFNYVMKSGTNQVHGSAYFGLRNEALNANTFANNARGVARPQDRKRNWALSFGGPVYIPKVYDGRNRTFFFTSYEQYTERNYGFSAPNRTAPIPDFYEGDFSRLLGPALPQTDALGRPVYRGAIYDPQTIRQVGNRWVADMFPGNIIPKSRFSEVSQRLNAIAVKHYLPTIRDANGQIPLQNNMVFPISGNPEIDHYQRSAKVDHILSERHRFSGSYNNKYAPRLILDAGGLWDTNELYGGPLAKTRRRPDYGWFARFNHDWTATARLLNTLTLSYNRRGNPEKVLEAETNGAEVLGIKGLSSYGYPDVQWGGGPIVATEQPGFMNYSFRADNGWGVLDTVSFSLGRHFLKMGVDIRHNQQNRTQTPTGRFTFAARGTAIPGESFAGVSTGYAFASYLLGIVDNAAWSDPVGLGGRRNYYAGFIQDDFKVSSTLTLNLGLRWELQPPVYEVADRLSSWNADKIDPASGLPGAYEFAGDCNVCTGRRYFGKTSWKDFGPRIGFAWRVGERWTARGAYGIMYEGDSPNGYNAVPLGKPSSVAWGGTYALAADPVAPWNGIFNWDQGFPNDRFIPAEFNQSWGNLQRPGMIDPNYGLTPYIQNWNFNLQRELPGRFVVDLGYVANKGTRLRNGDLVRINQLPVSALEQYGTRLNTPIRNEQDAIANGIRYPYPGFQGNIGAALRPYPQVQGNNTVQNYGAPVGFSTYHSLQVTLNREMANGLTIYSNYVWSKNLSNVDSSLIGDNDGPLDYYNLQLEKTVTEYDTPHMFKAYVSYDLPFARDRGWMNKLFGGWSAAGIVNYYSGVPIQFSAPTALQGGWNGATNRPNVAAGELKDPGFQEGVFELSTSRSPSNLYLNREMFSAPAPLTLGTGAKRYSNVRGFGTTTENLTLTKSHQITEQVRFQLRGELLNLFNRHTLGGISGDINNPNFGYVTSVSGNRQVQISGRIDF